MKARQEPHQTTVRFTEQDLALLDAIQRKTGIVSRTEILRRAIRALAEQEDVASQPRARGRARKS
jgi:metal-responsive CopG/Arc/MetJ family transcriptional regulator